MTRKAPWILLTLILMLTTLACRFGMSTSPAPLNAAVVTQVAPVLINPSVQDSQNEIQVIPADLAGMEYQDKLLTRLYEVINPGVVSIQFVSELGGGLGSGFVYDKQGHIVTNYHVVEGAEDLEVHFPSGFKVRGQVIGKDLDSDLAVIKIDAPANELFPLELGDSNLIKVGQSVIAIGNPFGLSGTMTTGIISARGRLLDSMRTTADGRQFSAGGIIQTDAAINPGNSGGPLLNLQGQVIGLNRAIRTNSITTSGEPTNSGIGFAVPVNIIKRVIPALIEDGNYDYPYLGISSRESITLLQQEILGLPQSSGAYVDEVVKGGPAAKAGLVGSSKPTEIDGVFSGGDLIIAADGRPVRVFGDLLSYLMENKSPGDTIVLTIIRNNQEKEVNVILDKRP
jgi:S1-C subfamily serine protease